MGGERAGGARDADLIAHATSALVDLAEDVVGALVYFDEAFADVARNGWGLARLLELGAANACSLEQAAADDADRAAYLSGSRPSRVVVFCGRLLHENYADIIQVMTLHSTIGACTVFAAMAEDTYAALAPAELRLYPFETFGEKVRVRLSELFEGAFDTGSVSVKACPLDISPISRRVFVVPAAGDLRDRLRGDLGAATSSYYAEDDDGSDMGADGEEDLTPSLQYVARALASLSDLTGWKANIFAYGKLAKLVAREAASVERQGSKRTDTTASIVVVDRAIDPLSLACATDTVLDRLVRSAEAEAGPGDFSAGALAQPSDAAALSYFDLILSRRAREAALAIRRALKEAMLQERLPSPHPPRGGGGEGEGGRAALGAVSMAEISRLRQALVDADARRGGSRHAALVGYADVILSACEEEKEEDKNRQRGLGRHALRLSLERAVLHLSSDAREYDTLVAFLCELASKVKAGVAPLAGKVIPEDVLRLTGMAYVAASMHAGRPAAFLAEDETLQAALADAILVGQMGAANGHGPLKGEGREGREGKGGELSVSEREQAARDAVASVFARATTAAALSSRLDDAKRFRGRPFRPLVAQVVGMYKGEGSGGDPDAEGMAYFPASIGGLLASGLGRFGLRQSKPKVSDGDVLVVFVLGGLSALEMGMLSSADQDVILGGVDVEGSEDALRGDA